MTRPREARKHEAEAARLLRIVRGKGVWDMSQRTYAQLCAWEAADKKLRANPRRSTRRKRK